jgi:predicted DNA-binding protein with PD1-like motif
MKYTKGTIGRVFVLKFDDGDILLKELASFVKKEKVRAATMIFIGALKKGDLVTGPKRCALPPLPNKVTFKDGWEVLGIGTLFMNARNPEIHIHGAMGKKMKTLTGCIRGTSKVFLVVEAVVFELKGVRAGKRFDARTGLNLLTIG